MLVKSKTVFSVKLHEESTVIIAVPPKNIESPAATVAGLFNIKVFVALLKETTIVPETIPGPETEDPGAT